MTENETIGQSLRKVLGMEVQCDQHPKSVSVRTIQMLGLADGDETQITWTLWVDTVFSSRNRRFVDEGGTVLDEVSKSDPRVLGSHTGVRFQCPECGDSPLSVRSDRLQHVLAKWAAAGNETVTINQLRDFLSRR